MNAISPLRRVHAGDGEWRHVGAVAGGVMHRIGLRAIRFHLNRAAASGGCEALASVREADAIRQQLGVSWDHAVAGDALV